MFCDSRNILHQAKCLVTPGLLQPGPESRQPRGTGTRVRPTPTGTAWPREWRRRRMSLSTCPLINNIYRERTWNIIDKLGEIAKVNKKNIAQTSIRSIHKKDERISFYNLNFILADGCWSSPTSPQSSSGSRPWPSWRTTWGRWGGASAHSR